MTRSGKTEEWTEGGTSEGETAVRMKVVWSMGSSGHRYSVKTGAGVFLDTRVKSLK